LAQLTIRLPDRLKKQMERLREINWSEVVRKAIEARIVLEMSLRRRNKGIALEAAKRQDEIAEVLASRYSGTWNGVEVIRHWRKHRYSSSMPP
jgi:Arc/MetJ-type ribon-helix-helix transcriptional regulator